MPAGEESSRLQQVGMSGSVHRDTDEEERMLEEAWLPVAEEEEEGERTRAQG